jgi:FkbM family methyltransferase
MLGALAILEKPADRWSRGHARMKPPNQLLKSLLLRYLPEPLLVYAKKRHYASVLQNFKLDEEPDLKIVRHLVSSGDFVLDVGANIGLYTYFLAKFVGPQGRVLGVEPVPNTFKILAANVEKLGLRHVSLAQCAAAEAPGTVVMDVPDYDNGSGKNYYQARIRDADSHPATEAGVPVQAQRLDDLVAHGQPPCTFIKIDVEGHELGCVRGALELIERDSPALLIELGSSPDTLSSDGNLLAELLRDRGYALHWFDGQALRHREPGDSAVNYFFLQDRHLEQIEKLH